MRRSTIIGREAPPVDELAAKLEAVYAQRVEAARHNRRWTERAVTEFVRRGKWFVDAASDELYATRRGQIFEPAGPRIIFDAELALSWFVDRAGDVIVLERSTRPRTWSEIVERKARRGHGAT